MCRFMVLLLWPSILCPAMTATTILYQVIYYHVLGSSLGIQDRRGYFPCCPLVTRLWKTRDTELGWCRLYHSRRTPSQSWQEYSQPCHCQ
ncbi:hypothetical protein F5887DRAFT_1042344 [Amanita rubescens]|nr:hypothetical protein F5887DRAFT_1042344 [Amanita rubescens]